MTMMNRSGKHELTSAIFAALVVALLVFASPVSAVDLSASIPATAAVGESVKLNFGLDLKNQENIPIQTVTATITGPGFTQTCVFTPEGTPISGCEGLTVAVKKNQATVENANRFGAGWNGAANVNTTFGYGYGFGFKQNVDTELVWTINWNTAGKAAGDYQVTYRVRSEGTDAERDFVLKQPKTIKLQGGRTEGTLEECRQAVKDGKLKATIAPYIGDIVVTNTAGKTFDGAVAVYKKYDEKYQNQILYSSKELNFGPGTTKATVDVPRCFYQLDIVCGDTIQSMANYPTVQYGDKKIKWSHQGLHGYCVDGVNDGKQYI